MSDITIKLVTNGIPSEENFNMDLKILSKMKFRKQNNLELRGIWRD